MPPTTSTPDEHSIGSAGPPSSIGVDEQEFESLLVSVLEPAYRVAYRLTTDPQDAEDLVQEAALRAFRFRHTFQRGTSFKAWFYRIVMNQFYTGTRRRRPTTSSLDSLSDAHEIMMFVRSAEAGLLRPDGDPAATLVSRMAEDDVARALASLPDEFRTVATLYFMDDLSYQEIADILDVPIGTVRSRLHRGRQMLQKQLLGVAAELGIVQRPAGASES
jgi:RNA polymerase sigma-70 factor, ECF subfamily